MKKKEIIIFYPYLLTFGGIEQLFCTLSAEIKVKIITFENTIQLSKYSKNIEVIKLNPKSYFDKIFLLKKYFSNNNFVLIPIMWGFKAVFFAYLANIKKYNVIIDDPPSLITNFFIKKSFFANLRHIIVETINKKAFQKANVRITTNKRNSIELKKHYSCNFKYHYLGIINKKPILKKSKKKIFILSISRLENNKNLHWIVNAISLLKINNLKLFKKIHVDILGKGKDGIFLKQLAIKNGIDKKIKFRGFVTNKIKENFLKKSHIFVIPAVQGYGIPALEALDYKNRLLINKESRITEIFQNNSVISICGNNFEDFNNNFLQVTKRVLNNNKTNFNINLPNYKKWCKFIYNNCI